MTKNITVIDEQKHVYGCTYSKRAKGLVKKGRAQFVDEKTICLVRPPLQMEDNCMNISDKEKQQMLENNTENKEMQPDMSYIMQKIEQIMEDSANLKLALEQLEHLEEAGAIAAGNMIEQREMTNRRMIDFLETLMRERKGNVFEKLEEMKQLMDCITHDEQHKKVLFETFLSRHGYI